MTIDRPRSRAYVLAPLSAVGTLMLWPLGVALAIGLAAGAGDGLAAGWLLGIPVLVLSLPLAYVGALVLLLLARLLRTDPYTATARSVVLASAACAQALALLLWLATGREGSLALTLIAVPAGVVGGLSFVALRRGTGPTLRCSFTPPQHVTSD